MKNRSVFALCLLLSILQGISGRFHVIREWKFANFSWPSEESYEAAVQNGLYIPENNLLAGIKYYEDFYYVTLPRMKRGVPATLARIPGGVPKNPAPLLEPFPSWEFNTIEDCNSLQNVQNIEIDAKGQMWIIDGGRLETLSNSVSKCSPKLVVYDIQQNRTISVYDFPEDVASRNGSFLYDIVVDHTDGGFAYISDNSAMDPGIIVYSVKENRSWKIRKASSFFADPSAQQFTVNGVSINGPINIAGLALGPKVHTSEEKLVINGERDVYFCPLSSKHLYVVNTTTLRNEEIAERSINNGVVDEFIKDLGMKQSQTVGMIMDNAGVLYFSLLGSNGIGRWDTHTPFQSGQRLVAQDDKYIEWPNSFTFDLSGNLTVLMNRLSRFVNGQMDVNEVNFRLISSQVGGKSYLFSDDFNYEPEGRMLDDVGVTSISTSTSISISKSEPIPSPEPEPEPSPENEKISTTEKSAHESHDGHVHSQRMGKSSSAAQEIYSISSLVLSAMSLLLINHLNM